MGQAESTPAQPKTVTVTAPPIVAPSSPTDTVDLEATTYYYTDTVDAEEDKTTAKDTTTTTTTATAAEDKQQQTAVVSTPAPTEESSPQTDKTTATQPNTTTTSTTPQIQTPTEANTPVPVTETAPQTENVQTTKGDSQSDSKQQDGYVFALAAAAAEDGIWQQMVEFATPFLPDTVMMKWDATEVCRRVCALSGELREKLIRRRQKEFAQRQAADKAGIEYKRDRSDLRYDFEIPWRLAQGMLERDERLSNLRRAMVPAARISEEMFWECYFERAIMTIREHVN